MLFSAKVVEDRQAGKIVLATVLTGIVFTFVAALLPGLRELAPFFIVAILVFTVIMAIIFRGDLSSYQLKNDLHVFVDGMQISRLVFPFTEVSELLFEFQSFYEENDYETSSRRTRQSFGLGNNLTFTYRNQHFKYQFYLQSRRHYGQFVKMLEQLYEHKVSFIEKNLQGRTFLMKNVDETQFQSLKRQHHFE